MLTPFDTDIRSASPRKPVLALMGEFSAGKSTLANLLIGSQYLPVQVVATRLPPVWITYGSEPPYCVDLAGNKHSVDLDRLIDVPLNETMYISISQQHDMLQQCDLIDMPGISDPNMSVEVWQRLIPKADAVIWCTHATQAWRQSEAAVWAEMPDELYERSVLLLTRFDKLVSEKDRTRVIKRVKRETAGLFADLLPISLLQATQTQDDFDAWAKSGAEEFAQKLAELLHRLSEEMDTAVREDNVQAFSTSVVSDVSIPEPEFQEQEDSHLKICPRRVVASDPGKFRPRPDP